MNKKIKHIGLLAILLSVLGMAISYSIPQGFWFSLVMGVSTSLFGVGLAVIVVNYVITSSDKKSASEPLLKLIAPNIKTLHNELFIEHLHDQLGKDQMESLIGIYEKHKRNPRAFSPEQRDKLYEAISLKKNELNNTYDALQEQFRELTMLLGWSFDSKITSIAFSARLSMATFQASSWDDEDSTKLNVIETYLDIEGETGTLFSRLCEHLGLKESDWQES